MARKTIASARMRITLLVLAAVMLSSLVACGGGSSGGGNGGGGQTASIPPSMTQPPVSSDPLQPRWFQTIYAPTISSTIPMVLNVADASLSGGTQLILYPQQAQANNELWQFTKVGTSESTSYGYFTSGLGDYPYNPYTNSNNPAQPMTLSASGNQAVSFPSQTGTLEGGGGKFQLWSYQQYCTASSCTPAPIVNQLTGTSVYVPSSSQGTPVTLKSGTANQWAYWPPRTIEHILAESDVIYPVFTGAEATAYSHLNDADHLGISKTCALESQSYGGVRCDYDDLNTSQLLAGYPATISSYLGSPPSGISAKTWNTVLKQVRTEIDGVIAVQTLYSNLNTFYTDSFLSNDSLVNELISDAQIESGQSVSGRSIVIFEGMLRAALSAVAGLGTGGVGIGLGAAANLIETGVNAALTHNMLSEQPFMVAVGDLWGQINSDFKEVLAGTGLNETAILDDFGRSQAIYNLIQSQGPDSLNWNPSTTPTLITSMQPGFEVEVMKSLLPTMYSIFPAPQTNLNPDSGFYIFDQWTGTPPAWDYHIDGLGNGVWDYFVLFNSGNGDFPGKAAIQTDVFDNGVEPIQFFRNLNGWKFPLFLRNVNTGGSFLAATGCNQLIVSVTNQTPDSLTLHLTEEHGSLIGSTPRSLPPYATDVVGFAGDAAHGPDFKFGVDGPNGSTQFEVQQNHCVFSAGDITYTNDSNNSYNSSDLGNTMGSYSNDAAGIDRIAVYNPSANQ